MNTTERQPLPAIVCTPWCKHGDGHPGEFFASDQTCYGKDHITPVSINNDHDILTVMAHRRGGGGYPNLCLNVYVGNADLDVYLTAGQARLLAESLSAVAAIVDGTESG